jgi:UPF0755 protein
LKKLIVLVLLLAGCGYAGSQGYDWLNQQVRTPMSVRSQPVTVHIDAGESPDQLAQDLQAKGLIRNKDVFIYYLRYTGARSRLQAGDFVLDRNMSMAQITDELQNGQPSQAAVQFPEGYTLQLMSEAAARAGLGSAAEYVAAANDKSWRYAFLADRPAGRNLEGFLFPDTYRLAKSATARDLVKVQLDRFDQVFTPDLRAQTGKSTAARPAVSTYDLIILASMTEREVNKDPDRATVCGIYYNRLAQDMLLQVDATVLYGLGKWHENVTTPETLQDTPYNTYLHKGLPPGPISNPGLATIKACLNPQKSSYLYYFTDPKGVTHYAQTSDETQHQQQQYGVA